MDRDQLTEDITRDEGVKLELYKCTSNKWTIGVGRNLEDRGITTSEAMVLLNNDIDIVLDELTSAFPWWTQMPESAQRALANMAFNLGIPRLSQFKKMLSYLEENKFREAAAESQKSRWAEQVGDRSKRIAKLIRDAN